MHISEGILSPEILLVGAAGTAIGITMGLRSLKNEDVPRVALLTSAFFVASLIHVPIGPSSSHLVLNGLMGIILGWKAFPAIFIGLALQAILFQFGGLTTLGINTFNMAAPAIVAHYMMRPLLKQGKLGPMGLLVCAVAGGGSIMLSALLVTLSLALSGEGLAAIGRLIFIVHIPVAIIEALVATFTINFLLKIRPDMIIPGGTG